MRVAMVMPMSPESAIADVMTQAVPELSQHWDLEVWCPTEANYRPCPVPLVPYDVPGQDILDALASHDLVVYVLGNSPWHSRILPLAQRLPGLTVLHDASLTDLVRHTAIETKELDLLVRDVTVAPLPVPSTRLGFDNNQSGGASRLLERLPDDAVLLVTVGAVNANRGIDLLLEAIADDEALGAVHLWTVGPAEDKVRISLLNRARALGLSERFAVTGRVTDGLLQEILSRAEISAALRDPVLEGQSASVLTQLLSGTPVIVYDHAHYAELPDDVVLKVPLESKVAGIRAALHRMVADDIERTRRGARGRDYVLNSRSGAAYAVALLAAGDRALSALPRAHVTADLGERMRRLGLHKEQAVVEAATDLAFDLFDLA